MKIKIIAIYTQEHFLEIITEKDTSYKLFPYSEHKGSAIPDFRFRLIEFIAKEMLDKQQKGYDKRISSKSIQSSERKKFNDIKSRTFHTTVFRHWLCYTQKSKYGPKSPFMVKKGKKNLCHYGKDKNECYDFACAVFGHKGSYSKAVYWLGNEDGSTKIEFGSPLETESAKEKPSILTQNDNDYVRFLFKTADLNYDIMKDPRYFNISLPEKIEKTSPDLSNIPREDNRELAKFLNKNKSVLILGPVKIGKTRMAFEEIRNIKNAYVFSLKQEAFHQIDAIKISDKFNEKDKKLIWFIDDIQYCGNVEKKYDALWRMREKLTAKFDNFLIVATLRTDKKHLIESYIFKDMEPLEMSIWTKKDEKKLAINYHKDPLKIKFTGNPFFSVIGEIKEMKRFYDDLPSHTKDILRYLKLLQEFLYPVEYKLLEDTYCYLVKNPTHANFEDCLNNLKNTGLIKREDRFILTWEPYLEKIVTTEDYPYLTFDLERLPNLFIKLKKAAILSHLISYFCAIKEFEKAIKYEKQMITIVAYDKYFLSYYNSGIILKELAEQKKDEKLYYEAFKKFALAVEFKEDYPETYTSWGYTLASLAKQKKDEKLHYEAFEKYKLAVKFKEDYPEAYIDWGVTLTSLAKQQSNELLYNEAFKKFALAIEFKKKFSKAIAYSNWGVALASLAEQKKDEKLYHEAFKKFALAVEFKENFPEVYYNWGNYLTSLAKQMKDEKLYHEAFEKFALAIKFKENFPMAYSSWGVALASLAEQKKDEKLYHEAFEKFTLAIKFKENFPETYYNWGVALASLAEQKKDEKLYREAFEKYKLAIKFKEDFPETYYNWGYALAPLAEQKKDEKLYCEAFEKFELAIKFKEDFPMAYFVWGITLKSLAKQKKDEKLYHEAFEKFALAIKFKEDFPGAYCEKGIALFEIAKLQDRKEKQQKLCIDAYPLLFKSYLLFILKDTWNLTAIPFEILKYIRLEIDNTIFIEQILIFEIGLKACLPDNKKSLPKKDLDFLQVLRGMLSEGDIIIDAILENKKPDVVKIPNNNLLLKTAVFLANKIIDIKRNLKK